MDTDPTNHFQNKNNLFIKRLLLEKDIGKPKYFSLVSHNSDDFKIYFLLKIHKTYLTIQPIVTSIGASSYNLSKYTVSILKYRSDQRSYDQKDYFEFSSKYQDYELPAVYVIFSLMLSFYTPKSSLIFYVPLVKKNGISLKSSQKCQRHYLL